MDWETLRSSCLACTRCELCKTRTNVVFGQGVEDAEVLFVGEGPGQNEDERERGLHALAAGAVPPAEAKDRGLPWPHCRPADDPKGFLRDQGAWPAVRKGRHPVHGYLPPCRSAAQPAEQACSLC